MIFLPTVTILNLVSFLLLALLQVANIFRPPSHGQGEEKVERAHYNF